MSGFSTIPTTGARKLVSVACAGTAVALASSRCLNRSTPFRSKSSLTLSLMGRNSPHLVATIRTRSATCPR